MFGFFKKKEEKKDVELLSFAVNSSISRIRQDNSRIVQWIEYLHAQNWEQKQLIESLKSELNLMPKSRDEIKRIIDGHYSFETMFRRLEKLEEQLHFVEERQRVSQIQQPLFQPVSFREDSKSQLHRKMAQKITRNSKEYVKKLILSLVSKYGKISALQLREIVVEEQGLVSKSSFYRLVEELEKEKMFSVVLEGKEKVFITFLSSEASSLHSEKVSD